MKTIAEDILELEAGLTPTEEPPTTMELVVEVTMEDHQTLVEVADREVLEREAWEVVVVDSGLEQRQVLESYIIIKIIDIRD